MFAQVPQVTGSRIERSIAVISEITTGDHSKNANRCERPRFGTAQGVRAIPVAYDLALASARQIQIAREGVSRIPIAVRPAFLVARIVSARVLSLATTLSKAFNQPDCPLTNSC
ncbi:MAG: hypothetical protein DMG03_27255 [Acidobacteria bacterium]|nr:MAG: hypothetical protein DMG03_27255 [Acidobacteriota bacterium]